MPLTLFYKVIVMNTPKRTAAAQLLLTFPAILFMGALVVRQFSTARRTGAYRSLDRNVVRGESMDTLGPPHHTTTCRAGHRLRHFGSQLAR
jgi:hypothetical protein